MVGFGPLRTSYALFIIALMVIGVVAGAFYFYNASTQNPCGDPGPATLASLPDQTISVNGQQKTYMAYAANFTGTQQEEVISGVAFYTTALNDPTLPHVINGVCATDLSTPASITVRITSSITGLQESRTLSQFKGQTNTQQIALTSDDQAGIFWTPFNPYLTLLVAK